MIEIRRILCPVDLSEPSSHALDHAAAIARWYESSLTVLHVVARVPLAALGPGAPARPAVLLTPPDRDALIARIRQFAGTVAAGRVGPEIATREGDPVGEILAQAREMSADLLVLGTHGRSGFDRLVLGSVTEKVLRKAEGPVLSVPPRAPAAPAGAVVAYRRVLCPVDFSPSSMRALQYAMSIAEENNAHLTVLHVVEYDLRHHPDLYETIISDDRLTLREFRSRCDALSRERLEDAVPEHVRAYCTVETKLAGGSPAREILRAAAEEQSDLIVIGVRGRGGADLVLLGSTAQHVVRAAACPVLTLRGE